MDTDPTAAPPVEPEVGSGAAPGPARAPSTEALTRLESELAELESELAELESADGSDG